MSVSCVHKETSSKREYGLENISTDSPNKKELDKFMTKRTDKQKSQQFLAKGRDDETKPKNQPKDQKWNSSQQGLPEKVSYLTCQKECRTRSSSHKELTEC